MKILTKKRLFKVQLKSYDWIYILAKDSAEAELLATEYFIHKEENEPMIDGYGDLKPKVSGREKPYEIKSMEVIFDTVIF